MRTILAMAVAIFSMFFGAGNAIFPLLLGEATGAQFGWAFGGLLVTAVGGPMLGLLGATLYRGRPVAFFGRVGKVPGALLVVLTYALLGPLAVMPRCVNVAHIAFESVAPGLPLWGFALLFSGVAGLLCWKRKYILPVLGYVLSPLLIGCLGLIIWQGMGSELSLVATGGGWQAFASGLSTGYDTMDLIAAIYFSAGIWTMIELKFGRDERKVAKKTLQAGLIGCGLLAVFYLGLMHAAARLGPQLAGVAPERLMTELANLTLGPVGGAVANAAIALACLTTVISLAMTLAGILSSEIFPKMSYRAALGWNLAITAIVSNLGFALIMRMIHPALIVAYPLIIGLTLVNIGIKMYRPADRALVGD
jgi:branched-chain amino acid:cation transporter, LIVCS family